MNIAWYLRLIIPAVSGLICSGCNRCWTFREDIGGPWVSPWPFRKRITDKTMCQKWSEVVVETASSENFYSSFIYMSVSIWTKWKPNKACARAEGVELEVTRYWLKMKLYVSCKEQIFATALFKSITRNHSVPLYVSFLLSHKRCRKVLKVFHHTR